MSEYQRVDQPLGGPNAEAQPARRYMGGFVSLHYVMKAISRQKRVWLTIALIGLLGGISLNAVLPSKYAAQTTLYMVHNSSDDQAQDMATDVELLQSEVVAQDVINNLHLQTTSQKLLGEYSGVATTTALLQITFNAPTAAEAVTRANVLATQFLAFRTQLFNTQNTDVVNAINTQIQGLVTQSNLSSVPPATKTQDQNQISVLNQLIQSDNQATLSITQGSHVVASATAITHSNLKVLLTNSASGLIAGVTLGVGLLAVLAILSDRIRRRDEFAAALGAPVELSVGRFGRCRVMRTRRLRRRLSRPGRPVELMTRQLRADVHSGSMPKRLAVVSVDSLEPAALSVAILAGRLAVFEGKRVMVIDLSPGRVLGELLGVSKPGTRNMFVKGAWVPMLVVVPPADDPIETGSIQLPESQNDPDGTPGPTWTSPEVVLVLSDLDLGIGAGRLAAVADEAVVIVTAGRSNAAQMRSTGESLRAAGVTLKGAILVGADHNDDSLGSVPGAQQLPQVPDGMNDLIDAPPFASAGAAEHH